MGWFLRREKAGSGRQRPKGKGGRAGAAGAGTSPRWDPHRTLLAVKVLGSAAAIGLAIVVWLYGQTALQRYATAHHAQPVTAEDVVIRDAPGWMTEGRQLEIRRLVAEQVTGDPMDRASLHAAARVLRAAWVPPDGVEQIKRLRDGRIVVEAQFREPFALVGYRGSYYMLSADHVRLPETYFEDDLPELNFPVIVGIARDAPPPGERWTDKDVRAGLRLAELIAGEPFMAEVERIDVARRDSQGRIHLSLITDDGEVRWGLPPGHPDEAIGPVSAAGKLAKLRRLVESGRQIDIGGEIVQINIPGPGVRISNSTLESPGSDGLGTFSVGE